ncbi:MAG: uroporphyrinogen decarboxylase family protein [Chloroflexota bacterium]|nr:uroporphyrinogen decarboxylase family protein [Chloroflexota bacterium]
MSQYTGRDHVFAAFERKFTDRVPVRIWYQGEAPMEMAFLLEDLRENPDVFAQLLIGMHYALASDTVASIVADPLLFAEAAGPKVGITKQAVIERVASQGGTTGLEILTDKSLFSQFDLPDLMQGERLPYHMQTLKTLSSTVQDSVVDEVTIGPWTMAMTLRGTENLIYDTIDDPDFVHSLLRYCTDCAKMVDLALAQTGIGILTIGDPSSGCSVISPKMFREWSMPYLTELITYLKERTSVKICLHICGKTDPMMEDMIATGADAVSIDGPSSLKKMVEISQGRTVVIGNVPTELFLPGVEMGELDVAVKECLDVAGRGGAYILSSGCGVTGTMEHAKHFLEVGRDYGRYERLSPS